MSQTSAAAARAIIVRTGSRGALLACVYAIAAVLLAVPMLVAVVPLGADDLNHLARIHVIAHIGTDPDLARIFSVRGDLFPYVGMDWLLAPLARVLPTLVVGRIAIVAMLWGLMAAVVVLQHAVTGRIGFGPAAVGLIGYNGMLAWGFLPYVLGLILLLLTMAAWHALRSRPWLLRLGVFAAAGTAIYLVHLLAFIMYGVVVASYELLGRPRAWRMTLPDWIVLLGQAVPAVLLWHALGQRLPEALAPLYVPEAKLLVFESPFLFRGAAHHLDPNLIAALFCGTTLYLGLRRGWLACPRVLAAPILVSLVLSVIVPTLFLKEIFFFDYRFPVTAACLALAGLRFTAPRPWFVRAIAAALAVFTVAHVADDAVLTHDCDRQYAELREAMQRLPRGAELTTVRDRREPMPGTACTYLPIYEHMAQLVTIDRSGYAPDFFSQLKSVAVRDGRTTDTVPTDAAVFTAAPPSGYVLWFHFGYSYTAPAGLTPLWHGSFFDLWAVRSGSG